MESEKVEVDSAVSAAVKVEAKVVMDSVAETAEVDSAAEKVEVDSAEKAAETEAVDSAEKAKEGVDSEVKVVVEME